MIGDNTINDKKYKRTILPMLIGIFVGLLSLAMTVHFVSASSAQQTDDGDAPTDPVHTDADVQDCQECHLDVASHWQDSPHAHAFDDEVFQAQWQKSGEPAECLACHTTNFEPSTGEYDSEGVGCESCHGAVDPEHPPNAVPLLADTDYCGTCHTTTLTEWHQTGHAPADIGCMDCHDPHSQNALFEEPDEMCINCHEDEDDGMGNYLEDLHVEKGIGCVDCHALVIPPEEAPEDGIVPTGHAFDITPGTCVACHTDALHAGFSLPGYEEGATIALENEANGVVESVTGEETAVSTASGQPPHPSTTIPPEQQILTLEAAVASQNVTTLFQGGVVGLVLGGSSAYYVATNMRQRRKEENDDS